MLRLLNIRTPLPLPALAYRPHYAAMPNRVIPGYHFDRKPKSQPKISSCIPGVTLLKYILITP